MNTAYISLGTNLGDRLSNIESAYQCIEIECGRIVSRSSFYKTPPWGFASDEDFVNSVVEINTKLEVHDLLKAIQKIEKNLGRTRAQSNQDYQDRIIDLDIIDYNGMILSTEKLVLPHPRMHLRDFVLIPLCEISPNWNHPVLNKSIEKIINNLPNERFIEKLI